MREPRKTPKQAVQFRTLAKGYKVLSSPLAGPFEKAAEVIEWAQPDSNVAETAAAKAGEKRLDKA